MISDYGWSHRLVIVLVLFQQIPATYARIRQRCAWMSQKQNRLRRVSVSGRGAVLNRTNGV